MFKTIGIFSASAFLSAMVATTVHAVTCGGKAKGVVTLTGDLLCPRGHGVYTDDDAVLDCAGYKIIGNEGKGYYGIYIRDVKNVTVKNCTVEHFEIGVRFRDATSSTLQDSTLQDNTRYGIELTGRSAGNSLLRNTVYNNNDEGIHISGPIPAAPGHQLINNTVNSNGEEGIYLLNSNNNQLTNNIVLGHDSAGIYVKNSHSNHFNGNTLTNDFLQLVYGSTGNQFNNTTIIGGRIKFDGVFGNTVNSMSVREQGGRPSNAYDFTRASENTITDSESIGAREYAIRAADSSINNQFIRFTATPRLRCYTDKRSSVSITGPNDEPLQCRR
jgi:parallel beta-helix repeat protein